MITVPAQDWRTRPLTQVDAVEVQDLVRTAFNSMEMPLEPPPTALSETAFSIAEQIVAGGGAGAEVAGRLVGSILWTLHKGLYVSRLAVHPQWRRRGIAQDLLTCAETQARRLAIQRVHLETRLALLGNLRLFAGCGFKEFYREPSHADPQQTLIGLEKWLP